MGAMGSRDEKFNIESAHLLYRRTYLVLGEHAPSLRLPTLPLLSLAVEYLDHARLTTNKRNRRQAHMVGRGGGGSDARSPQRNACARYYRQRYGRYVV